jgi:hypothetical protein
MTKPRMPMMNILARQYYKSDEILNKLKASKGHASINVLKRHQDFINANVCPSDALAPVCM